MIIKLGEPVDTPSLGWPDYAVAIFISTAACKKPVISG